jgi:hypothetical protein
MRHASSIILALALLSATASAFGIQAHKDLCERAVEAVWGGQWTACLDDSVEYCLDLKNTVGEKASLDCMSAYASKIEVHPATAPHNIFQDYEHHVNHRDCPLTWLRTSNEWICDGSENPAGEKASLWFDMARNAGDTCTAVRRFCTGTFYQAKSRYPLAQVQHLTGCLSGSYELLIDEKIIEGQSEWTVKDQCVFSMQKQMAGITRRNTQNIMFIYTSEDYQTLQSQLISEGEYVRNPLIQPPTSTTTSTTVPPTTSTTSTTSTTVPERAVGQVREPADDIDELLAGMLADINQTQRARTQKSNTLPSLIVLFALLIVSSALLIYIYSVMRRPRFHKSRKVIIPPSVRRKMMKKR